MRKREDAVLIGGREFILREIYSDAVGWPIGVVHAVLVTERERRWWWRIGRNGGAEHTPHADKIIPQNLESALKMWLTSDYSKNMSLIEFLTGLGVIE